MPNTRTGRPHPPTCPSSSASRVPSPATTQPLIRPKASDKLDYEGEIAIVIGKGGRHIKQADAYDHIAALTLCNEGTLRDWVRHAKFNVTQGKNFDRSGAMGPWLVPFTSADQLDDVRLSTRVNGELRQEDRTSRMVFPIRRQIEYISTFTTLVPGRYHCDWHADRGSGAQARAARVFLKPGDVDRGRGGGDRRSSEMASRMNHEPLACCMCEQAADDLYQAELTGQQVGLLSLRHPGMDMDDSYAIQSALVEKKAEPPDGKIIGWKIGLTSKAMQAALNIDIPDSGVLFDDMAFR